MYYHVNLACYQRAATKKLINEGHNKGMIDPRAQAQRWGETKSWGLDARGCRLLLRHGVVPWW